METERPKIGFFKRLSLVWFRLMGAILQLWIRPTVLPAPFEDLELDPDKPICYVIDWYETTSLAILDKVCETLGLPRPRWPMQTEGVSEPRSYLAMRRKTGMIIRRPEVRRHSETLKRFVENVCEDRVDDIQLVPVTILIGRAPDKETGLAKIFFTESWEIGGRFWRFLNSIVNGRNTMVQFSDPISLATMAEEGLGPSRTLRKVSRILRVHFQRQRAAAIGPDLSHRRTVVEQVLRSPSVSTAIEDHARKEKVSRDKAAEAARAHAYEIAANYSYGLVRIVSFLLTWFWNRIYDGVEVRHFRSFKKQAPDYELIYVPCHRSHIDYLLLSYILYHRGFVPPHIAAGLNLNLPILGRVLRKGGAFFLRRSFRSNKLYSAVFHEYIAKIMSNGTAIEYFIEGTRSRTGRLLQPKGGMLSMTVRSYLRTRSRPVMFQPIYIGYEKLAEGKSYIAELSGEKKKKETWGDLLRARRVLKQQFGKVHVSFSEPIFLDDLLDRHDPNWRDSSLDSEEKPSWLTPLVNELGLGIMTGINLATHVNGINLLAVVLLTTRKLALGREELIDQLALYLDLVDQAAYSDRLTRTQRTPEQIIDYGIEMGVIEALENPLGDIIAVKSDQSILLTYFRNNIAHLAAVPSLVTSCFLNTDHMRIRDVRRIALAVYPFLKAELFLPWDYEGFLATVDGCIDWLLKHDLLLQSEDETILRKPEGGTREDLQLRVMGHALLQTFERYYIVVAVLAKNGSGVLSRGELERLCILTAQRISQLNEFAAPEFYDRHQIRQFINLLVETSILRIEDDKLEFNSVLQQINEDSKLVLSEEIRYNILRVAPQVIAEAPL
ncbi:MAG: glycerol-3-phosphate 1-O-acyltransferase PlsB [Xanthomonadales bacterium]|nr:glycerol-3-phosphate 1-O-acyltransferase PlsB [Gammaproteobacteria bacterium]NNJ79109.1 glycerol-3-phosphate 1-O-acyltransferase PlsB [Xanthomonadales bacterium]NNL03682.1 glycerol-3-phosphate 1-O-acyltransferase PlsB [Xanthomonadales bacterium]